MSSQMTLDRFVELPKPVTKIHRIRKKDIYIYFIQETSQGFIKIGRSTYPYGRLMGIQGGNPHNLILLGFYHIGYYPLEYLTKEESRIHEQFKHLHFRGEWYKPSPELYGFIEENTSLNRNPPVYETYRFTHNGNDLLNALGELDRV